MTNPDPGYGNDGFGWGLVAPSLQVITVGMRRQSFVSGCLGYKVWSTIDPTLPWWFKDGIRGSNDVPYTPGWYKWSICGTYKDITFILYSVSYDSIDGPGFKLAYGDVAQTYNAQSFGGDWASCFGLGWQAFWLKGDAAGGIEDISVDIVEGTGVFEGIENGCAGSEAREYNNTTWGKVKALYR